MPNHVHVLISDQFAPLGDILHGWKSYTSRRILEELDDRPESGSVWQRDYHDVLVKVPRHYHHVRCYIWLNPVRASLVDDPFEWPFSSVHDYPEDLKPSIRRWYRRWRNEFWEWE